MIFRTNLARAIGCRIRQLNDLAAGLEEGKFGYLKLGLSYRLTLLSRIRDKSAIQVSLTFL